jgi:hypothetical protein
VIVVVPQNDVVTRLASRSPFSYPLFGSL